MALDMSSTGPSSYKPWSLTTRTVMKSKLSVTGRFDDQYHLGEELGMGQFGIIRKCVDKITGEIFACKSIAKSRLVTRNDLNNVQQEIDIMTKLSGHPNIVDLKAVYEEMDYVHLVMELCAGGELFNLLEKQGAFPEAQARVLFKDLMQVVMYCHEKGIVHRDLKPENILLATKSSSSPIKLADFGLATYIKPGQILSGTVGSPFYIAPEVLAGGYNEAADVWSAGVILYIVLSGMAPFWGKTKSKIFDAVRASYLQFPSDPWDYISASAKDLITRMLCTDASQRLTASQVLDHAWIKTTQESKEKSRGGNVSHGNLDLVDGALCCSCSRTLNRDLSFDAGTAVAEDNQQGSPAEFTCRSSFSSFMVEDTTGSTASGGLSYHYCGGSNSNDFSFSISSMPSFAFSSFSSIKPEKQPVSTVDKVECVSLYRDGSLGDLFASPKSSARLHEEIRVTESKTTGSRRGLVEAASRGSGIRSKRNRTIGLGEHEQLDLMVSTSVVRWASCTNLPGPASLRSSLVF